jgi:ActR/RegA family two-component response regulator
MTIDAIRRAGVPVKDDLFLGGSLEAEMHRYEAGLIKRALDESGGRITAAARLLNISHQGLGEILDTRHPNLRITPKRIRRKSIMTR